MNDERTEHPLVGQILTTSVGNRDFVRVVVDRVSILNNWVWCHEQAHPAHTMAKRPHELLTLAGEAVHV